MNSPSDEYPDLDAVRFGILEKYNPDKVRYDTGLLKEYTRDDAALPLEKREPIIFTNSLENGLTLRLDAQSIIGFFAPQGYKVSYMASQVFDGECEKPDFDKLRNAAMNKYDDHVETQDASALFTLGNLGIDLSTDPEAFPHGKCVNFFWKLEKDPSYTATPELVEHLTVGGGFGLEGFQDTATHTMVKFNDQSHVGLRIGINETWAGLLTEISLGNVLADGSKEFRQVLDVSAPTDNDIEATAHVSKLLMDGHSLHLAFNQGCGSPYTMRGPSKFSFDWAFASTIEIVVPNEHLKGTTWMPLYSDGTQYLDEDGRPLDTAPILNLKGYHLLNGRVEDYKISNQGKIIEFTYNYRYQVARDMAFDSSDPNNPGGLMPFLWFSQRVRTGDAAKIYLIYEDSESVIDVSKLQNEAYRASVDLLNCDNAPGHRCMTIDQEWKCVCNQFDDQKLLRIVFEYGMDSGAKVGLEISADGIVPNENPYIKTNFSISPLGDYTRFLVRLQPRVFLNNFTVGDEFAEKYIFRIGRKADLDEYAQTK